MTLGAFPEHMFRGTQLQGLPPGTPVSVGFPSGVVQRPACVAMLESLALGLVGDTRALEAFSVLRTFASAAGRGLLGVPPSLTFPLSLWGPSCTPPYMDEQ